MSKSNNAVVYQEPYFLCPTCGTHKMTIGHLRTRPTGSYRWFCYDCGSRVSFEHSFKGGVDSIQITNVDSTSAKKVMNIFRIATPTGEVFFHKPGWHYGHNGEAYDRQEHHRFSEFHYNENTCVSNILDCDVSAYDRDKDIFTEYNDDIILYVGHVTMDEWEAIEETMDHEDIDTSRVGKAVEIIKEKQGIDRRHQFKTQDYGPGYFDRD